ncbi:MAG: uroporphyrinogen-III synthase [Burkholderiales bacterium]|nr:uroporphyrinogen-III synthase [Burkholderiales bacterium]
MNAPPPNTAVSSRGPLHGAGIIVTRPARQAAGLAAQLSTLGATPLVFPAIVILPPTNRRALERAHAALDRYDIAIFVSANAVEYGVPPAERWPARLQAFAPGPGTASALVAAGVADVMIPRTSFDSEGLLALPALADVAGCDVVIFRGEGGRDVLGEGLRARGARVAYVECYRRAAPASGVDGLVEALREGRMHALTLTSSEGADNLWRILDADARALLQQLPSFLPHPRIAEHARRLGLSAIATEGSDAGLIAGLLEWFASHPPRPHETP